MTTDYDFKVSVYDQYRMSADDLHDLAEVVEVIRESGNAISCAVNWTKHGRAALAADPEHRIVRRRTPNQTTSPRI